MEKFEKKMNIDEQLFNQGGEGQTTPSSPIGVVNNPKLFSSRY